MPDLEQVPGFVGVAVPQHVDRPGGEVLRMGLEVADVRLRVSAGPVQQDQRGFVPITRMQVAGADAAGVQVALRERHALQVTPNALELRHQPPLLR